MEKGRISATCWVRCFESHIAILMLNSCQKLKYWLPQGCMWMIACMLGAFSMPTQHVQASCGDYLKHRFGAEHSGSQMSSAAFQHRTLKPVPAKERCYSCRGATIPTIPPPVSIADQVDWHVVVIKDSQSGVSYVSTLLGQYVPSISEGAYPSLLRPPIA